ncbi:MAG: flavodoxin [Coriobacteriia bacterium]|nr:flavodoxin [Coriobacteriia bacterium]MBS5478257.1 flavodoxin [Coriobacteriia bacterium]
MGKKLVAYFSASGVTKALAQRLAAGIGADLYEIVPEQPYTDADLDWTNKKSRSTIEMQDPSSRPAIAGELPDLGGYDEVLIGFPIWWYTAPTIIDTFVEGADLAGKKVALFATSGSSGMGKSQDTLSALAPDATWVGQKRFEANASENELTAWAQGLGL